MSKEAREVGLGYRSRVLSEAWEVADQMRATVGSEAIRFPGESAKSASGPGESVGDYSFLIVDAFKIKKFSAAGRERERDTFSVELLKRLGYISGKEVIEKKMEGVDGNLLIALPHRVLPYQAEILVHNMGSGEYLLSGFTISPK